jgi:hypothetical protein
MVDEVFEEKGKIEEGIYWSGFGKRENSETEPITSTQTSHEYYKEIGI